MQVFFVVKTTVRRTSETAIAAMDDSFFLNVVSGAMVVTKSLTLACARVVIRRDNTDFTDAIKRVVSRACAYFSENHFSTTS